MSSAHRHVLPVTDPRDPVPTPGISRPPLLSALTSLRFFVALHVALYHFVRPFDRWGPLSPFFSAGYSGVSFFFLLSGFILTYTHAQEYEQGRGEPLRFWTARFARIYPVYAVSLIAAGYVGRQLFEKKLHLLAYLADFAMLQSWSVRLVLFFNVPAWSLSTEAFFYLLFPFIFLRFRRKTRGAYLLAIAACTLLAMTAPMWALLHYPAAAMHEAPPTDDGVLQVLRIRRLPILAVPQFLAGISLGWLYLHRTITRSGSALLATGGIALLAVALLRSQHLPFVFLHNGLLIPLQCAIILGLTGRHWLTRLLSHPWLMLLGEASYSFYLIHMIVFEWMIQTFATPSTITNALWRIPLIAATSILLYLGIERPGRRLILTWYKNKQLLNRALRQA